MHLTINSFISETHVVFILWQSDKRSAGVPGRAQQLALLLLAPLESVLGGTFPSVWDRSPLPSAVIQLPLQHLISRA